MKLTSTNRPFGLTIKFTWHHLHPTPQNSAELGLAEEIVSPETERAGSQLFERPRPTPGSLNVSSTKLVHLMLFSCERSPAGVVEEQRFNAAFSQPKAKGL